MRDQFWEWEQNTSARNWTELFVTCVFQRFRNAICGVPKAPSYVRTQQTFSRVSRLVGAAVEGVVRFPTNIVYCRRLPEFHNYQSLSGFISSKHLTQAARWPTASIKLTYHTYSMYAQIQIKKVGIYLFWATSTVYFICDVTLIKYI